MTPRDDIKDICDEFRISAEFVEFVWAVLQGFEPAFADKLPPLGAFVPRTKRECALSCAVALRRYRKSMQ